MIALIDYGLGNIQAFANIYKRLGIDTVFATSPNDLQKATHIILPGVGAFDWAMNLLDNSGLRNALDKAATIEKKPILGICVGMQMMANSSQEGKSSGLGWIDGTVIKFDVSMLKDKPHLPHMGWNDITPVRKSKLLEGLITPRFYFLHSYFFSPTEQEATLATSFYGAEFTSVVQADNLYGTQFHPEKSHNWGINLLKNFSEVSGC